MLTGMHKTRFEPLVSASEFAHDGRDLHEIRTCAGYTKYANRRSHCDLVMGRGRQEELASGINDATPSMMIWAGHYRNEPSDRLATSAPAKSGFRRIACSSEAFAFDISPPFK